MRAATRGAARALLGAGAVVCGLAAALLAPWYAPRDGAGRAAHAVLCDVSPSVVRTRPSWRAWLAGELEREAERAREHGRELVVLAYGRERRFLAPERGAWESALAELDVAGAARAGDAAASDLWAALEALEARLGERAPAHLTWLAPGDATGRDPSARLARLAARAGGLELRPPPPPELPDVGLVALELPRAPAAGSALVARLWIAGEGGVGARLDVRREAPDGPRSWSSAIAAESFAREPRALDVDLGVALEGSTSFELRLTADGGGDAVPENDVLRAQVAVGDALRVALVAGAHPSDAARGLAQELAREPGLDVRLVATADVARALSDHDVLVQLDPELARLPARALESFLALGGGWLWCSGADAPGREAWSAPAAELLPLDFAPDGAEARDLVLVVDRSGSMGAAGAGGAASALDEARGAALRLVAALPERERVELATFAATLDPSIDVGRDPARALAPLAPGGATDVVAALDELARRRADAERPALALLVSDGRDQTLDVEALAALRERLRARRVELEVLAVGAEPDLAFLGALAGDAQHLRVVAETADLATALARAAQVQRERRDGPYAVASAEPRGLPLPPPGRGELVPERAAYVVARARDDARRGLLVGPELDDLLAGWSRGRGRAAALAGTLDARDRTWLVALVRWLGEGRRDERARLALRGARLELEDVPADWPATLLARRADGAPGEARLLPPATSVVDPRDRREGTFEAQPPPDGLFVVASEDPDAAPLALLVAEGPRAPEFALPPLQVALPGAAPAVPEPSRAPGRAPHPLGRPLLLAGLLLVLAGGLLLGRAPAAGPVAAGPRR